MTIKKTRLCAEDIWESPDDGNRYEVIDGALYVSPPPQLGHQHGSSMLHGYLWTHIQRHDLGYLFSAPTGVVLDESNGVQPDLVFVTKQRAAEVFTERGIVGAPDLVVEILSPSTESQDRRIKLARYEAAGVPHCWLLDTRRRRLEVFQLEDGTYRLRAVLSSDEVFRPALFPGLEIPLSRLWL